LSTKYLRKYAASSRPEIKKNGVSFFVDLSIVFFCVIPVNMRWLPPSLHLPTENSWSSHFIRSHKIDRSTGLLLIGHESTEEGLELHLHSPSSALDGLGYTTPSPGRFTLRKGAWYPLYGKLGGHQGQSAWVRSRENLWPLPEFEPRTVRPVVSPYTDYAILVPHTINTFANAL
jgi:hypothetical protein